MAIWSKLFRGGGGDKPRAVEAAPEVYEGFTIRPEPIAESEGFRVAARIEMERDGEIREHHMIRADLCRDSATAVSLALRKAKAMIDQQGERIFD